MRRWTIVVPLLFLVLPAGCRTGWERPSRRGGAGPARLPAEDPKTVSPLLAEVGRRTREPSLEFALRLLRTMGASLVPQADGVADGRAFLAALRDRLEPDVIPLAGDLVVFDEGWLIGVVTSVRADGTVEFVFPRGGVVRRGFLNTAWPSERRDSNGRVLNTFIRPFLPEDGPSQRYLAAELLTGYLRLERLVR